MVGVHQVEGIFTVPFGRKLGVPISFLFYGILLGMMHYNQTTLINGIAAKQHSEKDLDSGVKTSEKSKKGQRYAIVNYVDNRELGGYLYGVFSQHTQLRKLGMLDKGKHISHFIFLSNEVDKNKTKLLQKWVGEENVRLIDPHFMRDKLLGAGLWPQVFNKLEAFNLTEFHKVIVLDNDIFIRKNIEHWFSYPTPAATAAGRTIEWNSGAMVISPRTSLYNQLLDYLPKITAFTNQVPQDDDTWNSGYGHQGFLSSFFTSNVTNDTVFTMPYSASILSSALTGEKSNKYFWRYRNDLIETVHLTTSKPWRTRTQSHDSDLCGILTEWWESVLPAKDIALMDPLPDFRINCPNTSDDP